MRPTLAHPESYSPGECGSLWGLAGGWGGELPLPPLDSSSTPASLIHTDTQKAVVPGAAHGSVFR